MEYIHAGIVLCCAPVHVCSTHRHADTHIYVHIHMTYPSQDDFLRSVEVWKETSKFREQSTTGGFYSEADMRKPVSEGGLGFSAIPGPH